MKKYAGALLTLLLTACSHSYYVVRHAEKAAANGNMSGDVPLATAGEQRAVALKDSLRNKNIKFVFSTNTIRTKSTALPTANHFVLATEIYNRADTAFIKKLKTLKRNTLVVGHSNTVDDIVNGLCNQTKISNDLADAEYDNLFVIKYKRFFGTKITFQQKKYGRPTP